MEIKPSSRTLPAFSTPLAKSRRCSSGMISVRRLRGPRLSTRQTASGGWCRWRCRTELGSRKARRRKREANRSPSEARPRRSEAERDLRGDRQEPFPSSALLPEGRTRRSRARRKRAVVLETDLLGVERTRQLARLQELPRGRYRLPGRPGRSERAPTMAVAERRRPRLPGGGVHAERSGPSVHRRTQLVSRDGRQLGTRPRLRSSQNRAPRPLPMRRTGPGPPDSSPPRLWKRCQPESPSSKAATSSPTPATSPNKNNPRPSTPPS